MSNYLTILDVTNVSNPKIINNFQDDTFGKIDKGV